MAGTLRKTGGGMSAEAHVIASEMFVDAELALALQVPTFASLLVDFEALMTL